MGMYTELVLKVQVKENLPADVKAVLNALFNNMAPPKVLPEHSFFQCPRWRLIGQCSSYYHVPWSTSRYAEHRIFSRSDLKDYDNEISEFVAWVSPYLDMLDGACIGWSWYEEYDKPTLLFKE